MLRIQALGSGCRHFRLRWLLMVRTRVLQQMLFRRSNDQNETSLLPSSLPPGASKCRRGTPFTTGSSGARANALGHGLCQ